MCDERGVKTILGEIKDVLIAMKARTRCMIVLVFLICEKKDDCEMKDACDMNGDLQERCHAMRGIPHHSTPPSLLP